MLRKAVDSGSASDYFVIFARDVVPYDVYEVFKSRPCYQLEGNIKMADPRCVEHSPSNTLLMRFLLDGGTVIWLGDIPFWYVTDPDNGKDIINIWNAPPVSYFGALGFAQVFVDNPPQPALWLSGMTYREKLSGFLRRGLYTLQLPFPFVSVGPASVSSRLVTWLSKRPILFPPELKVEPSHVRKAVAKCLQIGGFVPLATTYVTLGPVMRIPISVLVNILDPTTGIPTSTPVPQEDLVEPLLKKLEETQMFTRRATGFSIGVGAPYISTTLGITKESEQLQPILVEGNRRLTGFFEAYPAWIRCVGRGVFVRLWDNVIEEKDVEVVASLVDKVAKDVLRAKAL
ncbi:MAG: hypothetical protein RQ853_03355 [Acidianus sp.]|nr:hypothetical protein [Acidianus sp.]